ncbi:MAG: hypothetical protein ACXABF_13920 [Candidatus Thorarchaeota archaeon]|jgi:hypothetical protein
METICVEVESKVIGGVEEGPKLETIVLELMETKITIADLIRRVVEEQIWNLMNERKMEIKKARRALDRQYLSEVEVYSQAAGGQIKFPSRRSVKHRKMDPEREVLRATEAYKAGIYCILINGKRVESLEETLTLGDNSQVTFLRLMPLIGGS